MRIIMVLVPQSISFSPAMIFFLACSLSSGATASSRSRKITSAADLAAFSNSAGLEPGTASSERCRREVAGSKLVKLMCDSPVQTLRELQTLPRRAESGGGAVDRHQQCGAQLLAAPGPVRAQQAHLRAADLVEGLE